MVRTLVTCVLFALAAAGLAAAAAQPEGRRLTLTWHGQSFFVLTTSSGTRVAFDPHAIEAYGRPVTTADVVLMSHSHTDHSTLDAIENRARATVIPGWKAGERSPTGRPRQEWNLIDQMVKDVRVRTVPSYHDEEQGLKRGLNTIFVVEADGLRIVHLGDLGHVLSDEQVKRIGPVDVLMIPAGGVYTVNGSDGQKVVAQLKPRLYVLPMHYGTRVFEELLPPDEFLDGLKLPVVRKEATNELEIPADLKADEPSIILLGWQKEK
jgi:L-ascorbate metabolism protein UlaG (beta-lactamase superfamily)